MQAAPNHLSVQEMVCERNQGERLRVGAMSSREARGLYLAWRKQAMQRPSPIGVSFESALVQISMRCGQRV